jgi:hypothetical protein
MHANFRSPGLSASRDNTRSLAPRSSSIAQVHEVFVRCSTEAAEQIRRGAMSGEAHAVRVAAGMLRDSARSIGALVLADVCERLTNARPDKLIDAACQWCDLIERLVEEVCEDLMGETAH